MPLPETWSRGDDLHLSGRVYVDLLFEGQEEAGDEVIFAFEDCELDTARYELRRAGAVVHVEPQVFSVLAYLIEHRDRVVPKAELLDQVW